jgi:6-phosphogluconolactonase (cycloisomerase 2 family)
MADSFIPCLFYVGETLMLKLNLLFFRGMLLCIALLFAAVTQTQAGYLYALNDSPASNNIYGYSVNETTGALTILAGFPLATGGSGTNNTLSERLTIDHVNNRLYVINAGSNTVSAYSINTTTGALTALPFSPIVLPSGFYVTVAVHPSGSPLVIGDAAGKAACYLITATTASASSGSPFTTNTESLYSSVFSRDGNFFYIGSSDGSSTFTGFTVNSATGVLTALAGSPFASGNENPLGLATDSQGRIFMINALANQLQAFTTINGIPLTVSGNPFISGLTFAVDGVLSPNENFYVVVDRNGNQVSSYQIAGAGTSTRLTGVGSPIASNGLLTNALVFNSAGTFLFASNGNTRNITTYGFNQTTGELAFNNVQTVNTLGTIGRLMGIDYLRTITKSRKRVRFF